MKTKAPKVEILQQNGYNFLWIDGQLWMWDIPSEVMIEQEMADQCSGDVLVAGYGMGVLQKMLMENPNVKGLLTVEIHVEVIQECRRVFNKIYGEVVIADIFCYDSIVKYDCVVGDVWEEIHPKFMEDYVRFRNQVSKYLNPGGKIISWGQDYYDFLLEKSYKYDISSNGNHWIKQEDNDIG